MTAFTHDSYFSQSLADADPEIFKGIQSELGRQQEQIELIASENIVSKAVLEAQGSVLTNKYAEGYPGRRYYGGCEFVDITEDLARERAKKLFGAEFVNVQPHSGAQANQAVFFALLQPGDTFLGMDLACGGHLTHGSPANQSGKWFRPVTYKVREDDHTIDYDNVAEMTEREKPKLILAGASAYARQIDFKRFREIADSVGAYLMVDMAHYAGLIAGGVYPDPLPHAHVVTTTTHKTLRGPRGGMILSNEHELEKALMTCNKNGVPFDTAPFTVTSGIRLGTPAGTTRGFGEDEFRQIGHWIADVVSSMNGGDEADPAVIASVAAQVRELTHRFPIYR